MCRISCWPKLLFLDLNDWVKESGLGRLVLPQDDVHLCRPIRWFIVQFRLVAFLVLEASFNIFSHCDAGRIRLISSIKTLCRSIAIFDCRVEIPLLTNCVFNQHVTDIASRALCRLSVPTSNI